MSFDVGRSVQMGGTMLNEDGFSIAFTKTAFQPNEGAFFHILRRVTPPCGCNK